MRKIEWKAESVRYELEETEALVPVSVVGRDYIEYGDLEHIRVTEVRHFSDEIDMCCDEMMDAFSTGAALIPDEEPGYYRIVTVAGWRVTDHGNCVERELLFLVQPEIFVDIDNDEDE